MRSKTIFTTSVIIIFITVFVFIFLLSKNNNSNKDFLINHTNYVEINGEFIKIELALTQKEQELGLSGRKDIKEDEGLLFIFNKSDKYAFWMKDMNFPIDIIWIGEDLKVVSIEKSVSPESYPTTFISKENARYVLEVISGFSEKNNLKEGDLVKFLP